MNTLPRVTDLRWEQDPSLDAASYQLGLVTQLMLRSPRYRRYPIANLALWIEPAIALRQIKFFFDAVGRPCGYLTWAFLADDVITRMLGDTCALLHISEWNEGRELWLMDMVAGPGYAQRIARYALDHMFPAQTEGRFLRHHTDGTIRRVVHWKRRRPRTDADH